MSTARQRPPLQGKRILQPVAASTAPATPTRTPPPRSPSLPKPSTRSTTRSGQPKSPGPNQGREPLASTARQRPTLQRKRILRPVAASCSTTRRSGRNPVALARALAPLRQRIPAVPPRARRLLGLTANVILVGTVLVVVGALAASLAPRLLGYSSVIVYGGSMAGTIPVGSIAVTEQVSMEDVGVGDVIVFHPPTTSTNPSTNPLPLMHRVVSVREEDGQRVFQTKGDANAAPDPTEVALQGTGSRVVYTVPYVGYLMNFAGTPLGWTLLLFLPATYLGLTTLRRIWAGGPPAR